MVDKESLSIEFNEYFREGKRFLDSWADWRDFSKKYDLFEKEVNEKFSGKIVKGIKIDETYIMQDFNLTQGTFHIYNLTQACNEGIRNQKALENLTLVEPTDLTSSEAHAYSNYIQDNEQSQPKCTEPDGLFIPYEAREDISGRDRW